LQPTAHAPLATTRIPPVAHFVWLGPRLAPLAWLAMRSALDRGALDALVLHADRAALADDVLVASLLDRPEVSLRVFDPASPLTSYPQAEARLDGTARATLQAIWADLGDPASQSNLIRLYALLDAGGLYLDTDAIVLRSLRDLLSQAGFAGLEHVCLPARVLDSRRPDRWLRAAALLGLRDVIARLPRGPVVFDHAAGLFWTATNNAVLGAEPGAAWVERALQAAVDLPDDVARRRFQLGPKLLERVSANRSSAELHLYPPAAFYPLGPEVSWHYFRPQDPSRVTDRLGPETYAAHLYDSVLKRRVGRGVDVDYLRRTRGANALSDLVAPWLDELFALVGQR
jgi:hypothetical protein